MTGRYSEKERVLLDGGSSPSGGAKNKTMFKRITIEDKVWLDQSYDVYNNTWKKKVYFLGIKIYSQEYILTNQKHETLKKVGFKND